MNQVKYNHKKVLVIGETGFLGSSLAENLSKKKLIIKTTTREILDLEQAIPLDLLNLLDAESFDYALICVAISDVEKCYLDQKTSEQVNVQGMKNLIDILKQKKIIPVFFSSDYVFSGLERPYDEDDKRSPLTIYGKQKKIIEEYIENNFSEYLIFRTSKLMSKTAVTKNILYPIIKNLRESKECTLFSDQLLNPVFIEDIAEVINLCIKERVSGVYHLGSKHVFTRLELGVFLAESLGYEKELVQSISMNDIKFSEIRPRNNSINCTKIEEKLKFKFCEVVDGIQELNNQIILEAQRDSEASKKD